MSSVVTSSICREIADYRGPTHTKTTCPALSACWSTETTPARAQLGVRRARFSSCTIVLSLLFLHLRRETEAPASPKEAAGLGEGDFRPTCIESLFTLLHDAQVRGDRSGSVWEGGMDGMNPG